LRQIVAAITLRLKNSDLRERLYIEWQTKKICQFVAATVPVSKGRTNTLLESANEISFRFEEDNLEQPVSAPDPDAPFDPEDHEAALARAAAKNKPGTLERLMAGGLS
jgi:inosine-uridine nucleoside N-ribohydrolase